MPFFRTTEDILKRPDSDELFVENWMNSRVAYLPPTKPWDYSRELNIEDVDIWELIYQESGGTGLYAAWCPYAEFYLITHNLYWDVNNINKIETFYGPGSGIKAYARARKLGMPVHLNEVWVEEEDAWLYG